ncbi:hypothetical protein A9Q79_02915 [Methylophaga sp. 42_25_T18]|nr:hypothetical protein A9Q79_02915 [Methylophaga sp. 42_25_T18]
MTDFWQSLLEQHSVTQYPDFDDGNYLMPLSQLGVLQVQGDDAAAFLQNLLTNDVAALTVNQSQLNGFCNVKGRLLAIFLLIRRADCFQIVVPQNMCAGLQQRLSMYVLRSKVTISDISEDLSLIGLAQSVDATNHNIKLPDKNYYATEQDNKLFIKLPSSTNRYLCLGQTADVDALCQELVEQHWLLAEESSWQLFDIDMGLATVLPDTKEKFTPQQLNFELIGGVSFNKGCYPGQEIVARLHYLGKPSRRLFSANCVSDKLPEPGQEFTDRDGSILGHVVSAQFSSMDNIRLLLSLKLTEKDKAMFIDNSVVVNDLQALAPD